MKRLFCLLIVAAGCGTSPPSDISYQPFGSISAPSGKGSFRFGVATAATQIEDMDTKTDWYLWTQPTSAGGLGNGTFVDNAVDGYTMDLADIQLLKDLHVDVYRFSIEWARVEPVKGQYDETALQHYSDLIDALRAAGIKPVVSLHHFSNPVWVDDPRDPDCANGPQDTNLCGLGSAGGPQVIQAMADFAKLCAQRYGDRVDEWGTLNEPLNYLLGAYGVGFLPPGKKYVFSDLLHQFMPVARDYLAAHAAMYKAIHQYDTVDADGDGVAAAVGITSAVVDWEPANSNHASTDPLDTAARDKVTYIYNHLISDALTQGGFDTDLDGSLDEPHPEWANTLDWMGVQYYFRAGVSGHRGLFPVLMVTPCYGGFDVGSCLPPDDPTFCVPAMGYESYPPGLYGILKDLSARYPTLPLVVSEGGIATTIGARRAENVVRTLEQIDRARQEGVDVRGYYHWSLYDNFEWQLGFGPKFGLYSVDLTTYARTPTEGATVFGAIAGARKLTSAQRQQYGGDGPMTPEPNVPSDITTCQGLTP